MSLLQVLQQTILPTRKPTEDEHIPVRLPNMFVLFLSGQPDVNPYYESVRRASEMWLSEFVPRVAPMDRSRAHGYPKIASAHSTSERSASCSRPTFHTSARFAPRMPAQRSCAPCVTGEIGYVLSIYF